MGGRRHLALSSQPGQEGLNLVTAQINRVTQAVEANKGPHPMDVGLLRTYAVVKTAHLVANLV